MNHSLTLEQPQYTYAGDWLLTKQDPLYAVNDSLTLTLKGSREQKVRYIKAIHTEKVNANY